MKAHIDALRATIETATGWDTYFVNVPERPAFPYVLLWSPAWDAGTEMTLCGARTDLDALVGITAVAGTPDGVLLAHGQIRATLSPAGRSTALAVPGRSAEVVLEPGMGQPVQVDRDVVNPETNLHPSFGVEMYRLRSTPAAP